MIEVKNLTKRYGAHTAVSDVSFKIGDGKIYGLLGVNGAGKTTTMKMIAGCLSPTSGSVTIDGYDILESPVEAKKRLGYLPEHPPVYPDMTPAEYLTFVAEAKKVPFEVAVDRIADIMHTTDIFDVRHKCIKQLSKGYVQRLGIAQALVGDPHTLVLDEPTVGLDPKQITEMRELIKSLGKIKTVLISSHVLSEIGATCDYAIIISHGKIIADASLEELARTKRGTLALRVGAPYEKATKTASSVAGLRIVSAAEKGKCGVTDIVAENTCGEDGDAFGGRIFFAFSSAGVPLYSMSEVKGDLESIFLSLNDAAADDGAARITGRKYALDDARGERKRKR